MSKSPVETPEGWALKQVKKAYRFNDQQRTYLEAKFKIGQESGMKLYAEAVAKEMRPEGPMESACSKYPNF